VPSKRKSLSEAWLNAGMINCLKHKSDKPVYDSPYNVEFVVAIGIGGETCIIKQPNIAPSLLEVNPLQDISEEDLKILERGVYSVKCRYHEDINREDGTVEDFYFVPEKFHLLWSTGGV
jgi:hypothetical protein